MLVVDDDCDDREALRELFLSIKSETTPSMDVQVAKNGKEAVYLHLAGASFDMIVMDNLMPVMNGIEVCQRDCREFFFSLLVLLDQKETSSNLHEDSNVRIRS